MHPQVSTYLTVIFCFYSLDLKIAKWSEWSVMRIAISTVAFMGHWWSFWCLHRDMVRDTEGDKDNISGRHRSHFAIDKGTRERRQN